MNIEKRVLADLPMSYAVGWLKKDGKLYGIAASEGTAGCILFDPDNPQDLVNVWENAGGTMGIVQTGDDGTFLAVQNFFKGFRSETACIVQARPELNGKWKVEKLIDLPYVHRFDVIGIKGTQFLVASTLCDAKDYKEDWSRPGRVWLGKLPDDPPKIKEDPADKSLGNTEEELFRLTTLIPAITKNHGFCRCSYRGRQVILISGMEGLFEIPIPDTPDGPWTYHKLLDREISEAAVVDFDGDGVEELVTIEGFHGNQIVINQFQDGTFHPVYTYPVAFGHVVWGGDILGRASILVGYREDNAALLLLQKNSGPGFSMEHIFIDELQGPTNICVRSMEDRFQILCSCGKTQQIVLYELTNFDKL